jgi:polyhydroxyalkanoate synthesis regulator phasin
MKHAILFCALLVLGSAFASAQTATPRVTKRQLKQQARIEQGVKSGELTAGEAKRLELQQGKIQADKARAKSDGVVTPAERAKLAREQNRASRKIYRLKHNEKTAK